MKNPLYLLTGQRQLFSLLLAAFFIMLSVSASQSSAQSMPVISDIEYATADGRPLLLDLYLPEQQGSVPVIIWIHGGAWRFGSKAQPPVLEIVDEGFAVASIDFRNSPEAQFPAQIHDIKAAIRFLRAKASDYGIAADNIALWGHSSGGHLAALAGTSSANRELEGSLGNFLDTSSEVQAIIDYSGPTNFETILQQSTPHGVSVREPALESLLGKPVTDPDIQALVKLASPVFHVNQASPALLLVHGVQDNQVPINQALELEARYRDAGRPVEVVWSVDGQHGLGEYFQAPFIQQVADFLLRNF